MYLLEPGPDAPLVTTTILHAKPSVSPLHPIESSMVSVFHVDNVILKARKQVYLSGNKLKERKQSFF